MEFKTPVFKGRVDQITEKNNPRPGKMDINLSFVSVITYVRCDAAAGLCVSVIPPHILLTAG